MNLLFLFTPIEIRKLKHSKLSADNIFKIYKKHSIIYATKSIKILKLLQKRVERVDCLAKSNALISSKDHKPNFSLNPRCRLINPAKSEIEKNSKHLEHLNIKVRDLSLVNLCQ